MKKYLFLFMILIFLISCSGSKQIIKEKDIQEFNIDKSEIAKETDQDSLAIKILNSEVNATVKVVKEEEFIIPIYKFTTIPTKTFDVSRVNNLLLTIVGKGNADISLSWQDNSGNWKTVKNGSKSDDIYTLKYSPDFVINNIGVGEKRFIAEILFDKDREPLMLETSLKIIDSNLNDNLGMQKNLNSNLNLDITSGMIYDDIYFDYKKWKIPSYKYNTNYSITINKIVKALKLNPDITVILQGFTDNVGSIDYNQKLGQKRCYTIGKLILNFFNDEEKAEIKNRIYFKIVGKNDPLYLNSKTNNKQINRRVSINLSYQTSGIKFSQFEINNLNPVNNLRNKNEIDELYKKAVKSFYSKNFIEANSIFESIYTKYPKHSLADNSKWWLGEILYLNKDFSGAIKQYNQVFGCGDGNKEAYAQYRIGCCYKDMGRRSEALEALNNVYNLYPNATEEWGKAQRVIKKISK